MNKKAIGIVLLWLGFLSGALATVWTAPAKGIEFAREMESNTSPEETPIPEDGWNLINWTWYGVSVAVAVFGIVMIRLGVTESAKKSEKTEANLAEIRESLRRLVVNVQQLEKDSQSLPPSQILQRIDDDLAEDLRIFAEGRESITAEFGLAVFADVMSHFASGERAVNRAWSASADGYVNEAETCLGRAHQMLQNAEQELNAGGKA